MARRLRPWVWKLVPPRVAQRAHAHARAPGAMDAPATVPKASGFRRYLVMRDRGIFTKDLDMHARDIDLRTVECSAAPCKRTVEQCLKGRGAGPVFRAADPLQRSREKPELRVALHLREPVAVEAQDAKIVGAGDLFAHAAGTGHKSVARARKAPGGGRDLSRTDAKLGKRRTRPGPVEARIGVGRIVDKGQLQPLRKMTQLRAAFAKKRADDVETGTRAAGRRPSRLYHFRVGQRGGFTVLGPHKTPVHHGRQAFDPRSARMAHQEGFGNVILRVSEKHMRQPPTPPVDQRKPRASRRVLQVAPSVPAPA